MKQTRVTSKGSCCKGCEQGDECEDKRYGNVGKENMIYKAIRDPKQFSYYQFPTNFTYAKASSASKSNTFSVSTNATGCAFIQYNFGQMLWGGADNNVTSNPSSSTWYSTMPTLGTPGNGVLPRSNTFFSSPTCVWNGTFPVPNNAGAIAPGDGNHNIIGSGQGVVSSTYFNSYRAGPAKVTFTYTGALNNISGRIYIGVSYSYASDVNGSVLNDNGLLPDLGYSTTKAIEDCAGSMCDTAGGRYEIYYIPYDFGSMDFSKPNAGKTSLIERVKIAIIGAPVNAEIGVCEIEANYECMPSPQLSEVWAPTNFKYATEDEYFDAIRRLKSEGQIRKTKNPFGLNALVELAK